MLQFDLFLTVVSSQSYYLQELFSKIKKAETLSIGKNSYFQKGLQQTTARTHPTKNSFCTATLYSLSLQKQ